MKKILVVYPNCSMGGMASVYRNRALSDENNLYHFVFNNDKGGVSFYEDLENAQITIVRKDRLVKYLEYLISITEYDEVCITSIPEVVKIFSDSDIRVTYEFHTSTDSIIESECKAFDVQEVDSINVPSEYLKAIVSQFVDSQAIGKLSVVPNLVDVSIFNSEPIAGLDYKFGSDEKKPLIWIGRLDKGKNVNDFLRLLKVLGEDYVGIILLGLEDDPERFSRFMGYASSLGVKNRVYTLVNVPQPGIASLFSMVKARNGFYVSTSLGESFGYGVQEALDSGVSTVAYDVGALSERNSRSSEVTYDLVDVGSISEMSRAIRGH
ncbi:glycosyltransferase [Glutamicibacter arilaitensis]|uniref:glycosyltransferase n=1 Tax=Glutamicibacter arilaitensis TaxID=256701 RepID=UPI001868573C|nr:glycosyltransferase [Glutamicibacter arilaitensis]